MRTRVLVAVIIAAMMLAIGCRSDKAKERQNAENQAPAAAASPSVDTSAVPPPPAAPPPAPETSQAPASNAEPKAKPKAQAKLAPPPPKVWTAPPEAAKVEPTPAPTPPPPIVVPAGTVLSIRTTGPISTNDAKANQEFQASVAKPVVVGGHTVIPVGAPAAGVILKAESAGRVKGEGGLTLQLTSLTIHGQPYRVKTSVASQESKSRGKRSAAMIGGGGGAGALIGGLAGGGKGAAIGALAGAAAGTAGATMTGKRDVTIPAETVLDFKLNEKLVLRPHEGGPSSTTEAAPDLQNRPPESAPSEQQPGTPPAQTDQGSQGAQPAPPPSKPPR
jgi:hypothetical protein